MKIFHVLLPAGLLALSSLIISCDSPATNVQDAKEDVAKAKADLAKANEEYRKDTVNYKNAMIKKIEANEIELAKLRRKIASLKGDARAEYADSINWLEKRNAALKVKITTYKPNDRSTWQSFKDELNHDMDELGKSLKDLTVRNVE